jgi:hypothetical protein
MWLKNEYQRQIDIVKSDESYKPSQQRVSLRPQHKHQRVSQKQTRDFLATLSRVKSRTCIHGILSRL